MAKYRGSVALQSPTLKNVRPAALALQMDRRQIQPVI